MVDFRVDFLSSQPEKGTLSKHAHNQKDTWACLRFTGPAHFGRFPFGFPLKPQATCPQHFNVEWLGPTIEFS